MNKSYTALLMKSNQMIEMKIPFHKQQSIEKYHPKPTQTETFYSCDEANDDYYRAILSMNEVPYFLVREIYFSKDLKIKSQIISDTKKDLYSNMHEIYDV